MTETPVRRDKQKIPNQGRTLIVNTPTCCFNYDEEDFQKYNIYFDLYSDGGDPQSFKIIDNIPIIVDQSWNPGSLKTRDEKDSIGLTHEEYTTKITNPNWRISINIDNSYKEESRHSAFGDSDRLRIPITIHLFCYASDGEIMTQRVYEKIAWHERHKFGKEIKQTSTTIQPVKEKNKNA